MKRRIIWVTGVCLMLLTGLGIAFAWSNALEVRRAANVAWQQHLDSLRAAGEPVSLGDVERLRPAVPPERNGALIIERLVNELEDLEADDASGVLFFDKRLDGRDLFTEVQEVSLEPSRTFLASHMDVLNTLHELTRSAGGRLTVSYDTGGLNPYGFVLPSLKPWRQAGKLLQLEALVAGRDDDVERAVEAILLQCQLAATLEAEPSLICRLFQFGIDTGIVDSLEGLMQSSRLDEQSSRKLERAIEARLRQSNLKATFRHERAVFLTLCDGLAERLFSLSGIGDGGPSRMPLCEIRRNQVNGAGFYGQLVQAADEPMSILSAVRRTERDLRKMAVSPSERFGSHRIVIALMPSFGRAVELHLTCVARLRCALMGLAADRLQQDLGRFPTGPEKLVSDYLQSVPLDPFSNSQLRVVETEYGLVAYSIGENSVDDGGDVAAQKNDRFGLDVGFRLGRSRDQSR